MNYWKVRHQRPLPGRKYALAPQPDKICTESLMLGKLVTKMYFPRKIFLRAFGKTKKEKVSALFKVTKLSIGEDEANIWGQYSVS
jgi:hypothetical protein